MAGHMHSPEPWRDKGFSVNAVIVDADGKTVADCEGSENLRRIVACVNALAGIPTEALEQGNITVEW